MSRLFAWLFNGVYLALILLASPWIIWSAVRHGKYRAGFSQKLLGLVPKREGDRPCVWLHAVSVGEVNLLRTTLDLLKENRPDWELVISTTTKTGYELASKKYVEHSVFYCPLDFSWAVNTAMRRVRPDLLVLAELELWPNLITAAKTHGTKIAIINGRLSDNSFRGYQRLQAQVARLLQCIDLVAAQNDETAERFLRLGANPAHVIVTGSLKFDGASTDRSNSRTQELRQLAHLSEDDVVLLAGSTQAPEEQFALDIYKSLQDEYPRLRLILVPRHPERFEEVAQLLDQSSVSWVRRTELATETQGTAAATPAFLRSRSSVLLVDSIGELGAWWGTATLGFVGGSFGSRGGQNMLEPAAYGVATCFGPNTRNFRDIVSQLLAVKGAQVVNDRDEFEAFVRRALDEPIWARQMGERAHEMVLAQQGATAQTIDLLLPLVANDGANVAPLNAA